MTTFDPDDFWRLHWRFQHGRIAWRDLEPVAEEAMRRWAPLSGGRVALRMRPDAPLFGLMDDALAQIEGSLRSGDSETLTAALTRGHHLAESLQRCESLWTALDALDSDWDKHCAELPLEDFEDLPCLSSRKALRQSAIGHLEAGRYRPGEVCLTFLRGMAQRWQGKPRVEGGAALRRCDRLAWEGVAPSRLESLKTILKSPLASLGEQLLDELHLQMQTVFAPRDRSSWSRRHHELLEQSQEINQCISGWLEPRLQDPPNDSDDSNPSDAEGEPPASAFEASSAASSHAGFQLGRFH